MEIDFIPIHLYSQIYWWVILMITIVMASKILAEHQPEMETEERPARSFLGAILFIFTVVYMGFRPIHNVFIDMKTYAAGFTRLQNGEDLSFSLDPAFDLFMKTSGALVDLHVFFLLCTLLYVVPIFFACRQWSFSHWPLLFLAFAGSFSFWAYGVNGIRSGIAGSLLLLAFSCYSLRPKNILMVLSVLCHKAIALPLLGYWLASRINIKWFFAFWALAIPLSLTLGDFWEILFSGLGFADERITMYLAKSSSGNISAKTGFRFDFLLYSSLGVAAGYFYVYNGKFIDRDYIKILGAYLFSNAIWILIIRASFSNRFAYLSWFLMAFVIFYPLTKLRFFENNNFTNAVVLVLYCAFSFYMGIFRAF